MEEAKQLSKGTVSGGAQLFDFRLQILNLLTRLLITVAEPSPGRADPWLLLPF